MGLREYSLEGFGRLRAMLGLGYMELAESCRVGVGEVAVTEVGVVREVVRECLGEMFSPASGKEREHNVNPKIQNCLCITQRVTPQNPKCQRSIFCIGMCLSAPKGKADFRSLVSLNFFQLSHATNQLSCR